MQNYKEFSDVTYITIVSYIAIEGYQWLGEGIYKTKYF